ncbi:IscA/HesB family protein [Desulfobulbus oligotrophicus]|uniref:IscA/HesB family protein n=1 Tax=Desulfobulbus oligotrophicus TaxID=1909699 RepID=A0A7T6APE9_9BACT|nr:IscA/HesB family protein [Desulfobulbus oligotrophicus]QQG64477.1 IscA/HesB family protein [Desulfobulbus oligotrophicus]
MFEVTALAVNNLKAYLEQNNISSAIRIALMQGGCSGPSLGLALDEPKDSDKVYEDDGLKFLVDNDLQEQCGAVKVDFIEAGYRSGFSITSANSLGGGGCNTGSCGCSCG